MRMLPDGTIDDAHRDLEQKSLRNVRALVDSLERQEMSHASRRKVVIALVSVPVVAAVIALGIHASRAPSEEAEKKRRACELDAWNARAAAFVEKDRIAHPGRSSKQVQDDLRRAQPDLMREAREQCK